MKITAIAISLLLPAMAIAQDMQPMSQMDIENMMKNIENMEPCMQSIDQTKMDALKKNAEKVESEVSALCKAGKRAQAQKKAITYGKEVLNDTTMQEVMVCMEPLKGMMKTMPMMPFDVSEGSSKHVCD